MEACPAWSVLRYRNMRVPKPRCPRLWAARTCACTSSARSISTNPGTACGLVFNQQASPCPPRLSEICFRVIRS